MLEHVIAILALAVACGAWVLLQCIAGGAPRIGGCCGRCKDPCDEPCGDDGAESPVCEEAPAVELRWEQTGAQ